MQTNEIIALLNAKPESKTAEELQLKQLAAFLNELILHHFDVLVQLLYRVDVPEQQVKSLLQEQPAADAGVLLATLLLKRQKEKEALRTRFKKDQDIPDEERW